VPDEPAIADLRARLQRIGLHPSSLPLGVDASEPFPTERVSTAAGDVLALYTDGLIEVMDAQGTMLGLERFRAEFAALADRPLPEIRAGLLRLVRAHGQQNDDQTLLLLKIVG
jgi:serine phosphatase RsbU (regulator of sigma subunit)